MAEMIKDARQTSDELGKFKDMSEEERQEISRIVGQMCIRDRPYTVKSYFISFFKPMPKKPRFSRPVCFSRAPALSSEEHRQVGSLTGAVAS